MNQNIPSQQNEETQIEAPKRYYLVLVIVRIPVVATKQPQYREFLESTLGELELWAKDGVWLPSPGGDETELNNCVRIAPIESVTEEQFRNFSRVVVPLVSGFYTGFDKPALPRLDWLKSAFPNHAATTQGYRSIDRKHEKTADKITRKYGATLDLEGELP